MVNEQNLIPKTEIIYELKENYEIQTSKLSLAARNKVIKMSGGNYLSERGKEGYGPMEAKNTFKASTSEYSSSSGDRGLIICNSLMKVQYSVRLRIECYNWAGDGETVEVNDVYEADRQAERLKNRTWNNAWVISNEVLDKCRYLIYDALVESKNRPIDGYIRVRGKF